MNGVSQIIGALMMYGIGQSNMSLAPWRALFIICGGLTSLVGVVFIFMMPRDTSTAWFLTEAEREIATQRLAVDRATRDRAEFNKKQVREAMLSPMTWIYMMMGLCITLTTPIIKVSRNTLLPDIMILKFHSSAPVSSTALVTASLRQCLSECPQELATRQPSGSALSSHECSPEHEPTPPSASASFLF